MSEKAVQQIFQGMNVKEMHSNESLNTSWVVKEDDICDSTSIGSMSEDSMNSECSTYFSSELAEEEVSSSTSYLSSSSSSSNISNGPLYELSDLITHLPIKRGLSMFYQGKAQSFTSLARVQSIEDLAKKGKPNYRKKMKSCKSYGGGLDSSHRISYPPKATISKKASRGSSFVSVPSKRESLLGGTRPSVAVVHKNF